MNIPTPYSLHICSAHNAMKMGGSSAKDMISKTARSGEECVRYKSEKIKSQR